MNIINKLTIRYLKINKSRTILTIIGICVSVALIIAVFTGLYSYLDYKGRVALHTYGDYHFKISAPADKIKEVLDDDKRIESYGFEYSSSKNNGYRLKDAKLKHTSVGSWYIGDKNCLKKIITSDYDGTLPENSKEILVEEKFITDNNLDWKIGDTVSIESGYRYVGKYIKFQSNGTYTLNEQFDYDSTDSYKITGILHGNFITKNMGTMLIRGADENQEGTSYALVSLKRVTPLSGLVINDIVNKFDFDDNEKIFGVSRNSEYLQTKLVLDRTCETMIMILPMCLAVLLFIVTASVVLIHNSFAMSLNEKIKHLGMLSSVGATKKQKKKSVIYEALTLSAIGVPIGIIIGVGIIEILFSLIGERIKKSAIKGELGAVTTISLNVKISLVIIAIAALIGFVTVLLSALIPSRRASSVTAIDAIRQSEEIKIKNKIRAPRLINKLFGYEGVLAFKNMKRNGAKAKIIVVSIALSLVLFIGCNYFCNMFVISTGLDVELPYQISVYNLITGENNENIKKFKSFAEADPEIKRIYLTEEMSFTRDMPETSMPLLDDFFNEDNFNGDYKKLVNRIDCSISYRVLEDESFNELCEKNGIDYKEYYDYEYGCSDYDDEIGYKTKKPVRVLLLNDYDHTAKTDVKPFNDNIIGAKQGEMENPENEENIKTLFGDEEDDFEITPEMREYARNYFNSNAYKEQFIIYGLVDYDEDNYLFHLDGTNSIVAFYPLSVYETIYPESNNGDDVNFYVKYGVETDNHARATEALKEFFESSEIRGDVIDDAEWRESYKATLLVLQVLIYGFLILISIITITNIINTIANSINHRRKEFAMLKSVGLEPRGFRKMLSLESLFYALEGTLFGLPLSVLACFIINKMMKSITVPFSMDIKMCIISVCVVFAIISLTMLYSSAKVRNNNIIEELKQEIN